MSDDPVAKWMLSIGAIEHNTAGKQYWHIKDQGYVGAWQATFFYQQMLRARIAELDEWHNSGVEFDEDADDLLTDRIEQLFIKLAGREI